MGETVCDEWALQQVRERRFLIDRCDQWIYGEIASYLGQRVLEVGCGLGNLMHHLTDRELVVGIDPDVKSIEHLRSVYADHGNVQAYAMDICDSQVLELESLRFDTIVSLNVFEHIADDALALRHTRELLKGEGHLVLIVPAHSWLYGTMDAAIGHHRRYSRASMADKLTQAGFRPVFQKYMNAFGALGWLVNGRVLQQRVPPSGQLHLFNLIVPFLQAVEQRCSPPFGISLLTVAK
jgi:SAM-dependent methyltransferase